MMVRVQNQLCDWDHVVVVPDFGLFYSAGYIIVISIMIMIIGRRSPDETIAGKKIPGYVSVPEPSSAIVREDEFAKQLRLARYLPGPV
jgi:hypothetical protein